MKIALLSNVNVESIAKRLMKTGFTDVFTPPGFNTWRGEILNPASALMAFDPQCIFFIIDGCSFLSDLNLDLNKDDILSSLEELFLNLHHFVSRIPHIHIFISNCDSGASPLNPLAHMPLTAAFEAVWNQKLEELIANHKNVCLFNLNDIIYKFGRERVYSSNTWYLGGMRFSSFGETRIVEHLKVCIMALGGNRKKVLVLDLDNTLWGGVAGEDGLEGVSLSKFGEGARFYDFQKNIKSIYSTGVLLAIVSKNNENDALEIIRNHSGMVLKEENFASKRINWKAKSENIKDIAHELNLGLDSFVFIDDNPIERAEVKSHLPDVSVPDFPEDTSLLPDFIREIYQHYFLIKALTDDDKVRNLQYKNRQLFNSASARAESLDEFLVSLKSELEIKRIQKEDFERVAQLCTKTNQFNLTTKRYLIHDIQMMANQDEYIIYVAKVKDIYGDNGKISVLIIKLLPDRTALVDTFLMSCRVMGRHIEDQILNFAEKNLKDRGFYMLRATYIPTPKNVPVADFYDRMGYQLDHVESDGTKVYSLNLSNHIPNRKCFAKEVYVN